MVVDEEDNANETVNTRKYDELLMWTLRESKKNTNKPACVEPRSNEKHGAGARNDRNSSAERKILARNVVQIKFGAPNCSI